MKLPKLRTSLAVFALLITPTAATIGLAVLKTKADTVTLKIPPQPAEAPPPRHYKITVGMSDSIAQPVTVWTGVTEWHAHDDTSRLRFYTSDGRDVVILKIPFIIEEEKR